MNKRWRHQLPVSSNLERSNGSWQRNGLFLFVFWFGSWFNWSVRISDFQIGARSLLIRSNWLNFKPVLVRVISNWRVAINRGDNDSNLPVLPSITASKATGQLVPIPADSGNVAVGTGSAGNRPFLALFWRHLALFDWYERQNWGPRAAPLSPCRWHLPRGCCLVALQLPLLLLLLLLLLLHGLIRGAGLWWLVALIHLPVSFFFH